ncbi:helix-turn-helix domain-containing protein [Sulfitobacter donghicola]|uniref:XRE family transcriptional regulator n=1 Tax=Sulfitobacter donghicola DSW-25 = KCTC 12864 = JCM 14565 TaxID=1300350 RepID=A0A073IYF2_9RHOB|nr:XRE family transcriptional regulator [Sulfitobacter donghicola]KEJ90407.1 XRE family transcriptional regulator [Sulfitobacter donghicola DSW-25 = KCTC 12864 = JCM 14565]KIN67637.1 putative HTH-type transcriptional regulator [Sulfitobacter donghicola DSW-25 = KCTC 12864 = JCM 14565]
MRHDPPQTSHTLGVDLRALRRARGFTLAQTAQALGRSVGWLSQVERDKSEPSITDLRLMAAHFDIPVSMLFRHDAAPAAEAGFIVRATARRPIGSSMEGLVEELLSPDLSDDFEMVHSTFLPHSHIKNFVQRPTQEVGYIISGTLEIEIDGVVHSLDAGDSFRIRGEAFRWANRTTEPVVAIWVIAPPVY